MTHEECTHAVRTCRDQFRKAKFHLELNLAGDVKSNKKTFSQVHEQQKEFKKKCGSAAECVKEPGVKEHAEG